MAVVVEGGSGLEGAQRGLPQGGGCPSGGGPGGGPLAGLRGGEGTRLRRLGRAGRDERVRRHRETRAEPVGLRQQRRELRVDGLLRDDCRPPVGVRPGERRVGGPLRLLEAVHLLAAQDAERPDRPLDVREVRQGARVAGQQRRHDRRHTALVRRAGQPAERRAGGRCSGLARLRVRARGQPVLREPGQPLLRLLVAA